MNWVLSYAAPACTFLMGLSAFFNSWAPPDTNSIFHGRSWRRVFSKTWFKIIWFISFSILSVLVNSLVSKESDRKNTAALDQRDLSNRHYLDSSVAANKDTTVNAVNKLLRPLGYQVDSGLNKIDSSIKTTVTPEIPSLDVVPGDRFRNQSTDSFSFSLNFKNTGNCPVIVNCDVNLAVVNPDSSLYLFPDLTGLRNRAIGIGQVDIFPEVYTVNGHPQNIYILVTGSYTAANGKKALPINDLFEWNIARNSIGVQTDPADKNLIENRIKKAIRKRK